MNNTPLAGQIVVVTINRVDKDTNLDGVVDTVYCEIFTRVADETTGEVVNLNGPLSTFFENSKQLDGLEAAENVIGPWIAVMIDEALYRQLRRYQIQQSLNLI
ncbi:hypothetical protein CA267_001705 [Alteromonas pelagimontana]|uniref:Curli production assembly/transport component CsgE n=1 Tax=Alteromonas pelagimontana TaxID=1858656 RepID=A0A6M4MAA2_9ALTE|nr:hypothetical protein [Alteromonas pelagimontana]QJR79600.1 hypothetical protein CA267_001705 [Alteromonas pelagimontana]